jgi:hypothetical protein
MLFRATDASEDPSVEFLLRVEVTGEKDGLHGVVKVITTIETAGQTKEDERVRMKFDCVTPPGLLGAIFVAIDAGVSGKAHEALREIAITWHGDFVRLHNDARNPSDFSAGNAIETMKTGDAE